MSIYTIPIEANSYYDETVTLEGLEWQITIRWNNHPDVQAWYMDLKGLSVPSIDFKGIKLVGGVNLLRPYAIIELGSMYVLDLNANEDPDFDEIGTRYVLVYADKTEEDFSK